MLAKSEIVGVIVQNKIKIIPILDPKEQIQGASVDLRLGSEFIVFKRSNITHLPLVNSIDEIKEALQRSAELMTIKVGEEFILHPGEFALASTLEYIKLDNDVAAEIHGKSSWARLGLIIHGVAGFVDPGFSGTLTLELVNLGKFPIPLYIGVKVAQLTPHKLESPAPIYKGRYGGCGVKLSEIYRDKEFDVIRRKKRANKLVL